MVNRRNYLLFIFVLELTLSFRFEGSPSVSFAIEVPLTGFTRRILNHLCFTHHFNCTICSCWYSVHISSPLTRGPYANNFCFMKISCCSTYVIFTSQLIFLFLITLKFCRCFLSPHRINALYILCISSRID